MLIPNKLNITYSAIMPDGTKFLERAESNAVSTEILTYSVSKEICCDKTTVRVGETARHTVTVTNNSSVKLFGNFFKIPQPVGASYVAGSVTVNGVPQPAYNPLTGFALPDLNPDEAVVIEYEIRGVKPTPSPVTHFAMLRYSVNDPVRGNADYSENTDTLLLKVISHKIDGAVQTVIPLPYYRGGNARRCGCCGCCYSCRCCPDCCNPCNICIDFYC